MKRSNLSTKLLSWSLLSSLLLLSANSVMAQRENKSKSTIVTAEKINTETIINNSRDRDLPSDNTSPKKSNTYTSDRLEMTEQTITIEERRVIPRDYYQYPGSDTRLTLIEIDL